MTIAQNNSDLEGWGSVGLNLKVTKKLSFSVSEHLRSRNDISTVKNYFTQIKANYEVLKNFELGGGIRYITRNDDVGKQGLESFLDINLMLVIPKNKSNRGVVAFKISK